MKIYCCHFEGGFKLCYVALHSNQFIQSTCSKIITAQAILPSEVGNWKNIDQVKQNLLRMNTGDQTIILGLQIFLDHRSSRTIEQKLWWSTHTPLVLPCPPPFCLSFFLPFCLSVFLPLYFCVFLSLSLFIFDNFSSSSKFFWTHSIYYW